MTERTSTREFAVGSGRAFAGALIFSLPVLMTMEMWWIGVYASSIRLALLLVLLVPLLICLSRYGGIRHTHSYLADVADVFVVIAIAFFASALVLWAFGVLSPEESWRATIGKIALQTFPASIGAALARNQLGSSGAESDKEEVERSYAGEIFLMGAGAIFLSLNVAPTEEMILIAYKMTVWQELGLLAATLVLMHAFVYTLQFRGTEQPLPGEAFWSLFVRYTLVGYAVVVFVSLYLLWTFGRTEGTGPEAILSSLVVLSFPGAIGAAAARLIL